MEPDKQTSRSEDLGSDSLSHPDEMKARIEEALTAEIGDAMVDHGRSGIRKLRGLVDHVEEIVGFDRRYTGDAVVFRIDMRYPRS